LAGSFVGWQLLAVSGFWSLRDNIYKTVCLLLQIFPSFLTGSLVVLYITENTKVVNNG
jgi:hypothetical protein